jgi:hypothetical protein
MTYLANNLIEAADYNGFVSSSANNINAVWSTGSSDKGYGQTAIATVAAGGTVTAPQWASLVNTLSAIGSHQGTTLTSRTAPVTGDLIQILANVATDINSITTNRGNAAASGSQYTAWTGTSAKTTATSGATWTITFRHDINFANANSARYFFNAGGRVKVDFSKTSTGATGDPEWNDLANTLVGDIYITGGTGTQNIAGTNYTGTTKIGGTGTPNILATTTGWYDLSTTPVNVYKQFADTAPYTANFIQIAANVNAAIASATRLTLTTTWSASDGDPITGGTAPTGATPGTAPTTLVTYFPPSTTYLTASWGTPTVAATTT